MKGITVKLHEKMPTGEKDGFGKPIYEEVPVDVKDVLVAPATSDDIIDNQDIEGRHAVYTLAIPKGDTHKWEDSKVEFFGKTWKTFGTPLMGIEENIPLRWNKKVTVELYE